MGKPSISHPTRERMGPHENQVESGSQLLLICAERSGLAAVVSRRLHPALPGFRPPEDTASGRLREPVIEADAQPQTDERGDSASAVRNWNENISASLR